MPPMTTALRKEIEKAQVKPNAWYAKQMQNIVHNKPSKLRFEGMGEDGVYLSLRYQGYRYYFDCMVATGYVIVRRNGSRTAWSARTFNAALVKMVTDHKDHMRYLLQLDKEMLDEERAEVEDLPF